MPPTSTDLSVFLRILGTNYGQKVKNTDAPEGVASITVSGGLERYTEKSRKIRRLRSLPTDCCKVDLEVLSAVSSQCQNLRRLESVHAPTVSVIARREGRARSLT